MQIDLIFQTICCIESTCMSFVRSNLQVNSLFKPACKTTCRKSFQEFMIFKLRTKEATLLISHEYEIILHYYLGPYSHETFRNTILQ